MGISVFMVDGEIGLGGFGVIVSGCRVDVDVSVFFFKLD